MMILIVMINNNVVGDRSHGDRGVGNDDDDDDGSCNDDVANDDSDNNNFI